MAPDLPLSVQLTRTLLSLPNLEINDFESYYLAPGSLGAQIQFTRNQVGSPWIDGNVTVNRQRQQAQEPLIVEVLGDSPLDLQTKMDALMAAMLQSSFQIALVIGTGSKKATYQIQAESADYQNATWSGPRWIATQGQIQFTVPCQPGALAPAGGYF